MSAADPRETRFDGVRVRYESQKGYDALLAALLDDIGEQPVPINDIATSTGDWRSYQERVEPHGCRRPRTLRWRTWPAA